MEQHFNGFSMWKLFWHVLTSQLAPASCSSLTLPPPWLFFLHSAF
jgi:hypothetical protein